MLGWLFPNPADRRLLPGGRFRGTTPFVIAIMTFSMLVVAAAGLALSNAAGVVSRGIESRFAVQVPAGNSAVPAVTAALRQVPGVSGATAVPEAEMRETLEQWLGPAGASADLPVPALVMFDLAPGADRDAASAAVERASPGATMVSNSDTLAPVLRSIRGLQWLALALVILMAAATGASAILAARGALDTHRSTIDIMHGIGATDLQVTRLFQRKIALDAMAGAAAGLVAAALVLALVGGGGAALAGELAGAPPLRPADLLILLALPLALVILATWVARTAVLAALRRSV